VPTNYCIHCTLPADYCVCAQAPSITLPKNCTILFHPREISRRNSTGRLLKSCTNIKSTTWHRLKNQHQEVEFAKHTLIFPHSNDSKSQDNPNIGSDHFLWIDSTWQESHKMMRQSTWLQNMPKYSIKNTHSDFRLRRNQKQDGLSTLESLAYWLAEQNHQEQSLALLQHFNYFQEAFLRARQDGLLK